jgi:hypothetical protein
VRESGLGSAFLIVRFEWSELREDLDCYLVMEEVTEELCGRMRWGLFCWRWVGLLLGLRREGHCSTTCVKGFVGGGMKADAGAAEESLIFFLDFTKTKACAFEFLSFTLCDRNDVCICISAQSLSATNVWT